MTGKCKVKQAMIFHLFNFFIHLPPPFASQTNLHLHRESASEAHRPLAGSMTSAKLSLQLCVAALCSAAAWRQTGSCSEGRNVQPALPAQLLEERQGRTGGFFSGMRSQMMASLRARASREDAPDLLLHTNQDLVLTSSHKTTAKHS